MSSTPAPLTPETTVADLLAQVPQFAEGTDLDQFVTGLVADTARLDKNGRDAVIAANVRRLRIGQAWATAMPRKRAEREAWMRQRGDAHGLGLSRVRQIIRAAKTFDQVAATISAEHLPIAVLDRRLEAVPTALRAVAAGRILDQPAARKPKTAPTTQEERQVAFAAKVTAAIRAVFSGHEQEVGAAIQAVASAWLPPPSPAATLGMNGKTATAKTRPNRNDAKAGPVRKATTKAGPAKKGPERVRPVLRYAGGKWFVADLIANVIGQIPDDSELREPFCGGASVAIRMLQSGRAKRVWLNDLDAVIRSLWNAVINDPDGLCKHVVAIKNSKETFDAIKAALPTLAGPEQGAAEIYLRTCGRGARANGNWKPMEKWRPERAVERIRETHELLRGRVVHGECTGLDGNDVIRAPGQAVLFLDPPYRQVSRGLYRIAWLDDAPFIALADAIRESGHPWVMTTGDDISSDKMSLPSSEIRRIPGVVRAGAMTIGGWLGKGHDAKEKGGKRELLWTSGILSPDADDGAWGLPRIDAATWEEWFGEGDGGQDDGAG